MIIGIIIGMVIGLTVSNFIGAYITYCDKDIPIDRLKKALDIADFDRQEAWRREEKVINIIRSK